MKTISKKQLETAKTNLENAKLNNVKGYVLISTNGAWLDIQAGELKRCDLASLRFANDTIIFSNDYIEIYNQLISLFYDTTRIANNNELNDYRTFTVKATEDELKQIIKTSKLIIERLEELENSTDEELKEKYIFDDKLYYRYFHKDSNNFFYYKQIENKNKQLKLNGCTRRFLDSEFQDDIKRWFINNITNTKCFDCYNLTFGHNCEKTDYSINCKECYKSYKLIDCKECENCAGVVDRIKRYNLREKGIINCNYNGWPL